MPADHFAHLHDPSSEPCPTGSTRSRRNGARATSRATRRYPVRLGYSEIDEGTLWIQEQGSEAVLGVGLRGDRGALLVAHLADELQEQFFPETEAAWGEPRPLCPGHTHPAQAG